MTVVASLASVPADVTLVDRRNHHLFQPLLYEVATAALSPAQIAVPLRHVFRRQRNATVVLGEVTAVDLESPEHAPGLKSVEDALTIRRRFLLTFERADRSHDPEERRRLMTTVIVGGGPTGIELAGTMSEVAKRVLQGEFRSLDPSSLKIVLAEGRIDCFPRSRRSFPSVRRATSRSSGSTSGYKPSLPRSTKEACRSKTESVSPRQTQSGPLVSAARRSSEA